MITVSVREAKARLSTLMETVRDGVEPEIIITKRGKPHARLIPLTSADLAEVAGATKADV